MQRRHFLGAALGIPALTTDRDATGKTITIGNRELEVLLDAHFPRVFEYRTKGAPTLFAALQTDRATVELNGSLYSSADFTLVSKAHPQHVSYQLTFAKVKLILELEFQLEGNDLLLKLVSVDEGGTFRLKSLYFPNHNLIRMPALTPEAMMYRGEVQRYPWKHPSHRGLFGSQPRFAKIAEEDGEEHPQRGNWAAVYATGLAATIANNIGTWKLASQFLGFSGRASDFVLWNGTYYYRLRGKVQPLLESRVGILTADANDDGAVDWMEAALWQRKLIRAANPLYAFPTYSYKIICAWWPKAKIQKLLESAPAGLPPWPKDINDNISDGPVTTFDECLEIIRSNYNLTGGVRQVVYLVGWQYDGHDDGYPSFDKVNPACGGREKLLWLAREAKKYNAIISYHINLDDAYPQNPGFDPSVLCLGLDGKPYIWCYYGAANLAYHISHTKEVESGYFQKRAQALLDTVPVEKTLNCDAFRYSNVSFAPGDFIGANEELAAIQQIFNWFAQRGIDIGSEGVTDGFYGMLSFFFHLLGDADPFRVMVMHGKAYGTGGEPPEPVLGWWPIWGVNNMQARPSSGRAGYSISAVSDGYYVGALLRLYLLTKELRFLGPEGSNYVARFADGCISQCIKEGSKEAKYNSLLVKEGDVIIARGQDDRFIPMNEKEIRLYSVSGGRRVWSLPAGWAESKVSLLALGSRSTHEVTHFQIEDDRFKLNMEPHTPYILRKK